MQGRDSNYNSNFKSMTDITVDNPYEDIFKFMVESEINSRNIERCELENLRSMYEDFQELSSRYDNGRKERDDVFLLIEKQFLAHPRQIEPIGFSELDYNLWDTEDESKVEKLRALFQHLNRTILDNDNRSEGNVSPGRSPGRSPNRQAEQLRSQENAFNAKIDILEHENNKLVEHADNIKIQLEEASAVIKQLNRSISDRDKECANFKIEKVKMNEQFATRELEQENEILDLCDEVNKKTKQLEERELMSPTSPQRHNTNALGESDVSALTREQLKTELTIKINDIRALENVSEKNKELVQNLFGTIDECMWTITQLKLGRPKKFTTPIGGLSQIIAKSVMGQIQDIGRFAKRFFSDSNVKNLEIDTVDNALDRSKYSQSSTTTPRRKKKSKFLKFLKPKKMPNEEELKKIVRDSFEIYDENQSGELERDEIRRLLDDVCEDINAPPVTDEKLDAAIVACDEDMNGKFNYDELYKLLVPLIESSFDETKKQNVLDIFKPKSSDNTPRRNKKKMFAFLKVKKIPTEDELKAIVKDSFEKYDEDKSGYLEREEIRKLLDDVCEEVGAPAIDDKNLEEAIVAADANGDGKFNCDELFSLIAPIITNAMTGEKKPTLFDVFKPKTPRSDISPDKKKNKKNLFDFMKVKKMPSEEELREMVKKQFEAYDEDESGYLERDEIRKLLDDVCGEIGSPIVTDEALDVAIEKADQNKDGKFNFGETFDLVGPILENAMSGQKKPTLLDIFKPKTGGDVTPDGAKTPGGTKKNVFDLIKGIGKKKDAKVKEIPSREEIEMVAQIAFDLYDADKSGFLERDEIKKLLTNVCEEMGAPMISDKDQDKGILENDTNGDGKFSFDELFKFIGPMIEESLTVYEGETKPKRSLLNLFKMKNKKEGDKSVDDGKKKPNLFDLLKIKKKPSELPSEEELHAIVRQAFEKYDEDSSGFLEKNEIKLLLRDVCTEIGAPRISSKEVDEAIKEHDKNADGKFVYDELFSMVAPIIQQSWDSKGDKKGLALLFSKMGKKEDPKKDKKKKNDSNGNVLDDLTREEEANMSFAK